jgi:hypothetical protein
MSPEDDPHREWPDPSLVSHRHILLRIRAEHREAGELADAGLAALDSYPQSYCCPLCGFEFSGDPGAKAEVPEEEGALLVDTGTPTSTPNFSRK